MAKQVNITFSKEHVGKSSGKSEVDTYRRASDSSKTEKTDHSTLTPGYGKTPVNVPVNKSK
ncbi:MAG: hypothetical protein PHW50_02125 [Patescibacteria group bacterium]|nr:hypothetical protein [Patescibacteria group bacterium]